MRPGLALAAALWIGAEPGGAAHGADPGDSIEAAVDVALASEDGILTFAWSGRIHRAGPGEGFDYRSSRSAKPAVSAAALMAPPFDAEVGFSRQETGETSFSVGLVGRCPGEGSRSMLQMRTDDSEEGSPFSLTERELEEGFARSFAFRVFANQCRFAGEAAVKVTLRKGGGGPQVVVEGSRCACGADGTAEVAARAASSGVVFEKFEVTGAPAGAVRRNEGGRAARLVLGNAARDGGPVTAVAVYRHQGRTRRAPPHLVHLALVEKPETRDNGIWGGRGGTDFVFDGGNPGRIEIEAVGRAWLDGKDGSRSLRWLADAAYLEAEPLQGARTRFKAEGLPGDNAAFGPRRLRAVLEEAGCSCQSEPREVRIFYWRDAQNNPERERPNWAHYWAQTRAGQGVAFAIGRAKCGRDLGLTGGMYDYCSDTIYLPSEKPRRPCAHPPGRRGGNEGIDCFAQTLRHERHHQVEFKEWWRGHPIVPFSVDDPDGDLMPIWVEAAYGCREGIFAGPAVNPIELWQQLEEMAQGQRVRGTQFSCPVGSGPGTRPFDDVVDSEVNAYWVGWTWPTGSANGEDWARPGKNWLAE